MQKAGIYIRVSTTEQVEHGFSVDEQRERLISYCKAMGWQVVGIYVDGAFSGKDLKRPGLQKMIREIKSLDVVVVYKLDRLSRSQKDTLSLIEDCFLKNKIDFVSLQEKLDTTTPAGRLMIGMLSAFAQLERETFMERSLLGRTGRARKGLWVGTSRPPIGYDYSPETQQLTINICEAEQVKMVFDLYNQGTGLQKIAAIMHERGLTHKYGDWTWWGGIITMLKNPVYIGKVTFKGQEFDGEHKPIITQEQFDTTQAMLAIRQTGELYKCKSPFSHLLHCANCGARMFYLHRKSMNREPKYYCYSRYGKPIGQVRDRGCKMRIWPAHLIDSNILSQISEIATNKKILLERFGKKNKPRPDNTAELKRNVINIDRQINKLLELYQHDMMPIDVLNDRIKKLYDEKTSIASIIKAEKNQTVNDKKTLQNIMQVAKEIKNNWDNLDIIKRIEFIDMLISNITVSEENIEITWAGDIWVAE